jgi:hypothetical protein
MERKVIEEIRNFLECGGGTLVWYHKAGGIDFSGRAAFFLDFPAASLGAAVVLDSDF